MTDSRTPMPSGRYCLLEFDGCGIAVQGSAYSVGLVMSDARRHDEGMAHLLGVGGELVAVETAVAWELAEVDHAG